MRDARQQHAGRGVRVGFLHRGDDRARGAIRNPVAQDAGPPFFPVPEKVLSQLRDAADPEETIEETVQGAIQATLPTAEVRYSGVGAEVVIQIADGRSCRRCSV
jgi:hypothetical protein